jgi:predicted lipoprotein with Yx(FWY)xxD motif
MHIKLIPVALASLVVLAAGCGRSDNDGPDVAAAPAPAPVTVPAPAPATAPPVTTAESPPGLLIGAKVGQSGLGDVLTSEGGLTLYGFTNDVRAKSTCSGTCADAWPPVIVDEDWNVGPGLDTGIFATTVRDDGSLQLVAGKWPLYTYSGDAAPGDLTGQGSGGVWFAVATDGRLIKDAAPAGDEAAAPESTAASDPYAYPSVPAEEPAEEPTAPAPEAPAEPAPVTVGSTGLGDALVDAEGRTLYGFTNDADGLPTCEGDCAGAWPPVIVDGSELPAGLDANVFSVVERSDGTHQLKAGKWPLYRFAGDGAAGETNGQGSGGVWFVVDPAGGLIKDAG